MIALTLPQDAIRSTLSCRGFVRVNRADALSAFGSDDWDGTVVAIRTARAVTLAVIPQSSQDFADIAGFTNTEYYVGDPRRIQEFANKDITQPIGHEVVITVNLDNRRVEFLDITTKQLSVANFSDIKIQVTENGQTKLEKTFG